MERRGKTKRLFRLALTRKIDGFKSGVWRLTHLCCRSLAMRKRENIFPIILVAGPSHHLPFPKPLAMFGGKTALAIAIENCAGLERPLLVLGCDAPRVRRAVPRAAQVVWNRGWRRGQISSLRRALKQIPVDAAFLIYPVDHPLLKRKTIQQFVRAFRISAAISSTDPRMAIPCGIAP